MYQAGRHFLLSRHMALLIEGEQGGGGGGELQEAGDGSAGAGLGGSFQVLAQQDEGDEHGRGLEEVGGAVVACDVVAHDVVVQDGDHGVGVGCIGPQADQHIHVSPACPPLSGVGHGWRRVPRKVTSRMGGSALGGVVGSGAGESLEHGGVFVGAWD